MLLQMAKLYSFLWLLLEYICIYVCMYVCTCVYTHIHTHTHHIFFIHSAFDGHLSCFHILAIVSNAVLNIGMHASFQISISFNFFRYIHRSGSFGSCDQFSNCRESFWDNSTAVYDNLKKLTLFLISQTFTSKLFHYS